MERKQELLKIHLHHPYGGRQDYYFRQASSVYRTLTPQVVGLTYQSLLNLRMPKHRFYANAFCTIEIITID